MASLLQFLEPPLFIPPVFLIDVPETENLFNDLLFLFSDLQIKSTSFFYSISLALNIKLYGLLAIYVAFYFHLFKCAVLDQISSEAALSSTVHTL